MLRLPASKPQLLGSPALRPPPPTHPTTVPSAGPACRLKEAFSLPDDPSRMYGVTGDEAQVHCGAASLALRRLSMLPSRLARLPAQPASLSCLPGLPACMPSRASRCSPCRLCWPVAVPRS